jgi:protoheme ferro-lyase
VSLKGVAVAALLALVVWMNRDQVPMELQFWSKKETVITVRNNSDRAINDVVLVVWSKEHPLGTIPKAVSREVKTTRPREATEVILRFRYGPELIDHHVATLTDQTGYQLTAAVNYAGVVTTQMGTAGLETSPVR